MPIAMPNDLNAERSVLGVLLLGLRGAEEVLPKCRASLFYYEPNRLIFRAVRSIFLHNKGIDLITIAHELERNKDLETAGGQDYLASLIDGIPRAYRVEAELRILENLRERRDCIRFAAEVQEDAADLMKENVPEKAIEGFRIIGRTREVEIVDCPKVMQDTIDAIEGIQKSGATIAGITTGLDFLDHFFGGFPRAALTIVAARPSFGKSAFCINAAMRASLKGKCIGFFSLEDTNVSVAKRMLCAHARVSGSTVMRGELRSEQWHEIVQSQSEISQKKFFFNDKPQRIEELCNGARRVNFEHGLDLLVIDYLQLILESEIRENRNVQIAHWTRTLKMLAQELNIALVLVSQLSRANEAAGRRPRLSDLRESGAIEQDADLVIFLHRILENEKNLRANEPRPVELIVAKNRNGPTGFFDKKLEFIPAFTLFFESP